MMRMTVEQSLRAHLRGYGSLTPDEAEAIITFTASQRGLLDRASKVCTEVHNENRGPGEYAKGLREGALECWRRIGELRSVGSAGEADGVEKLETVAEQERRTGIRHNHMNLPGKCTHACPAYGRSDQ